MIGNRTKVKVVKNKVAPPFREAEFDILYGEGISKEGELIDLGAEHGIVEKTGAWYAFGGERIGQGRENARDFLREHPDVAATIEARVREKFGLKRAVAPAVGQGQRRRQSRCRRSAGGRRRSQGEGRKGMTDVDLEAILREGVNRRRIRHPSEGRARRRSSGCSGTLVRSEEASAARPGRDGAARPVAARRLPLPASQGRAPGRRRLRPSRSSAASASTSSTSAASSRRRCASFRRACGASAS